MEGQVAMKGQVICVVDDSTSGAGNMTGLKGQVISESFFRPWSNR